MTGLACRHNVTRFRCYKKKHIAAQEFFFLSSHARYTTGPGEPWPTNLNAAATSFRETFLSRAIVLRAFRAIPIFHSLDRAVSLD